MTMELRPVRHARLAHVLAQQADIEPQVLVTHYQEAGDRRAAFEAALAAARFADTQLAFDRAARFYQTAIDTGDLTNELIPQLYRKLGDALGHAGRGRDSAHAYSKAAECAGTEGPLERVELTRRAAEQLLISGNTGPAAAIWTVLRAVKIRRSRHQSALPLVFLRG
jgi:hypothetical protein